MASVDDSYVRMRRAVRATSALERSSAAFTVEEAAAWLLELLAVDDSIGYLRRVSLRLAECHGDEVFLLCPLQKVVEILGSQWVHEWLERHGLDSTTPAGEVARSLVADGGIFCLEELVDVSRRLADLPEGIPPQRA